MINIGGEFVRRAAANVTSTVTTVASVATGGVVRRPKPSISQDDSLIANSKEKYNLNIKVIARDILNPISHAHFSFSARPTKML